MRQARHITDSIGAMGHWERRSLEDTLVRKVAVLQAEGVGGCTAKRIAVHTSIYRIVRLFMHSILMDTASISWCSIVKMDQLTQVKPM